MAVNDKTARVNNANKTDAAAPAQERQPREDRGDRGERRERRQAPTGSLFMNINGGSSITDKVNTAANKLIEQIINPLWDQIRFTSRIVDAGATNLQSHMVEIAGILDKDVSIYQLVIDNGGPNIQTEIKLDNKRAAVVHLGAGDAVTETLIERSLAEAKQYHVGKDCLWVGANIVLHENVKDESGKDIDGLIKNAMNAILASFQPIIDIPDMSLATDEGKLIARVVWTPQGVTENLIGIPYGEHARIELTRQSKSDNTSMDIHQLSNQGRQIGSMSAFFDVDFFGISEGKSRQMGRWGNVGPAPFGPRMILCPPHGTLINNATVCSTVLAATAMANRRHYWPAFIEPSYGESTRNVGALNTIVSIDNVMKNTGYSDSREGPERFVGETAREDVEKFTTLMLDENLSISVMCPIGMPESWVFDLFDRAAYGDDDANERLIEIFDDLLDGKFASKWGNDSIVLSEVDEIQLGYHTDRRGIRYPVHAYGLIDVATHFADSRDSGAVDKWIETWCDTEMPTAEKYAGRRTILEAMLGQQITYVGQARIVTLAPEAIEVMQEVAGKCLRFELQNPNALDRVGMRSDSSARRGNGVGGSTFGSRSRSRGDGDRGDRDRSTRRR